MSYRYDDSSNDIKADLIVIVIVLALALVIHIASSIHAVGHRFSTCYIYECNKCGEVHEFNIKR